MRKEKSCGAIVFKRAIVFKSQKSAPVRYLILHYTAGHWDFPKGAQEKNESEEQTAAREVKEETGIIDIGLVKEFKETIKYFYKHREETVYKDVIFFLAQTNTKEVKISSEHIGYAWASYAKAYEKLTYNNSKELLRKAAKFMEKQIIL